MDNNSIGKEGDYATLIYTIVYSITSLNFIVGSLSYASVISVEGTQTCFYELASNDFAIFVNFHNYYNIETMVNKNLYTTNYLFKRFSLTSIVGIS